MMNVRSLRAMVRGNITCLETKLAKLEEKEIKMVKKLNALSAEFESYHSMRHCGPNKGQH